MIIFSIVTLALFVGSIFIYNGLIQRKNQVANADSSIDVMLKKRFDLIPNLVDSVKTYMKHEASVLTELTELRTQTNEQYLSDEEKKELDKKMNQAITHFNVAVENYPDLKASDNFMQLQRSLNESEEQISAARRSFNAAVTELNNAIEMFPSKYFASAMGLKQRELLEIPQEERENVSVSQLFSQ